MGNCLCFHKKAKPIQPDIIGFPCYPHNEPPEQTHSDAFYVQNAPSPHPYCPMGNNSSALVSSPLNNMNVPPNMTHNAILGICPGPIQTSDAQQVPVRALYTYQGQHQDDLQFEKGDTMYVVSDLSSEWWFARHPKTGQHGYIPSNYVTIDDGCPKSLDAWYDVGRREADRILLHVGNPKGTYIIRSSSEPMNYALSVRHHVAETDMWVVKHYRIRTLDNNAGYYISNRSTFGKIQELINYYSRTADGLCCRLTIPYPRKYCPPVQFRDFEVNRSCITRIRRLGQGSFGEVWLAKWNSSVEVAIKMRLNHTDRARFIEEARLMHQFHHPRIVQLLGVCTQPEDQPVYIITEWMRKGALVEFLRSEEGQKLTLNDLIDMMAQITSGMAYLEKKNSVHRDLRAANILVDADNSVKVSDFGLAKIISDSTQADHNTKFPIKWTAPEAALHHIFSIKSDVWSFGVLVYEMVTYGGTPYPGMSTRQTITEVDRGYRLPNPNNASHPCPDNLYTLMLKCWDAKPENRPAFQWLSAVFEDWSSHSEAQYLD